jgi:hypothetical protein
MVEVCMTGELEALLGKSEGAYPNPQEVPSARHIPTESTPHPYPVSSLEFGGTVTCDG